MKLRTVIFTMIITTGVSVQAQQLPESNLYSFNKYGINPAYAGYNDCAEGYGSHLSQWVGIDGAPTTDYFSIHTRVGKNMGIGGGLVLDQASYISRFSGRFSYAYGVKIADKHSIRFGLSAGLYQLNIDATDATVDDMSDDVISGGAQRGATFDSEFGIFYRLGGFQLGVSVPQIFETRAKLNFQDLDGFTGDRHFIAYAGYNWQVNKKWSVEPSMLYKTVQVGLTQMDFNTLFTFQNMVSIGVGYRTHSGLLARLGVNIKEKCLLGYAYEFAGTNISSYTTGSHEIMLGFTFCKKTKLIEDPIAAIEPPKPPEEEPEEIILEEPEESIVEELEEIPEEETISTPEPQLNKELFKSIISFPKNDAEHYELGKSDVLQKMAEELKKFPNNKILIVGHACDLGSSTTNLELSKERAELIKTHLVNIGVNSTQITTRGMADKTPLVPNTSESNRAKNRRVEFVIQ
jgi:type IX secretion system PorP/SprF family membrane protein